MDSFGNNISVFFVAQKLYENDWSKSGYSKGNRIVKFCFWDFSDAAHELQEVLGHSLAESIWKGPEQKGIAAVYQYLVQFQPVHPESSQNTNDAEGNKKT